MAGSTRTIAQRVQYLRRMRGWSAATLAERCAEAGLPALNRSVLANLECGRRAHVTTDELLVLALVLEVAPVHLLVPVDGVDTTPYEITPGRFLPAWTAREWIRGRSCPPGVDPRRYFSEIPASEWEAR